MKKITTYLLIALGVGFGACEDDLDTINPNQPTIGVFWTNAQDAEQGVNAIYSTTHRGGFSRWMPLLYISRSDVGFSPSPWAELANALDRFIQPNYNFGPVVDVWVDNYIGVFRANQVIANVPNIEMEENLKNRLLGEAYFLRGMFYYHLASLWGNVPLLLEPSRPSDLPPTVPQQQVWEQVIADLELAASLLPTRYADETRDLGRATRGAAYALMAKTYMMLGDYDAALEPLQWLVEGEGSALYDLVPNYRDNFLVFTENNIESVFEIQFAENLNEDTDNDIAKVNHNFGTSVAQFLAPRQIGWSDVQARRWVVDEFMEEQTVNGQRDPRLPVTFIFDFTDERGPEHTMVYGLTFAERYQDAQDVWFRKFLNDHWKNEEGYRSPNNWRFIRYADVLLMYAEALNATGNTQQAYQHVDRVRERVGLAPLSEVMPNLDQEAFLEQLKHERLLELAGEGHRWNDLLRWGDLGPQLADRDPGFANFELGKHELLPIPQQDRDINPNLEQNPNW